MRLLSFDRSAVLHLDPTTGRSTQERLAQTAGAWAGLDQGRWAPDAGGVLALYAHAGTPMLLVDQERFVLDDEALQVVVEEAPPRRRFRLSHGARTLREREYDAPRPPTTSDEDDWRGPRSDADLDFAAFLSERLACRALRRSFRDLDFGPNLFTPARLAAGDGSRSPRLSGCATHEDELVLGALRLSKRHPTARTAGGYSFELGAECRLRRVPFSQGEAVVLRLFDLSRTLEGGEELLAGWVPHGEPTLEQWLQPLEARLEEIRRRGR